MMARHDTTLHDTPPSLHSACFARLLQDGMALVERVIYFAGAAPILCRRPERVKRQKQNKDLYRAFYATPTSIAHPVHHPHPAIRHPPFSLLRHVSIATTVARHLFAHRPWAAIVV